jgi:acetolactate synthase-1/2/3 large subunit
MTEPGSDSTTEAALPAHGGALLTDLLIQHGVELVFGLPGGQTYALYDGIQARPDRIRHVLVRDERSAAYAADAYARLTGRVGVCDATVGPGTAKLPSGLSEAMGVSIPIVALVSDLPARLAQHRYRGAVSQALDQVALLTPVTKWVASVPDLHSMPDLLRQAFREATTGRPGPTALILPQDILDAPLPPDLALSLGRTPDSASGSSGARFGVYPPFRPYPDPRDIVKAVEVLRHAKRPMILAGGGVHISGAQAALSQLAEWLSAGVATTLSGKGVIAEDHPLAMGVMGSMGVPAATAAMDEADVVLLVGMKSSGGSTYNWTRPRPDQTLVQIDIDPLELGRVFPLTAAILADARAGLEALLVALSAIDPTRIGKAAGSGPNRSEWRDRLSQHIGTWRTDREVQRASDNQPIWPQRVLGELEAALGPNDILICDASLSSGWGGVYLEQRIPGRKVLMPRGQAGLGYAVPAAIGAANADRSRRTVVLVGDGALGYAVGEFATIIEERLPVTVIVLNNRSLGWIRWYSRIAFDRGWQDEDFNDFDYSAVARAYGWSAERVIDPKELKEKLATALKSPLPSLLDLVTETWETPVTGHRRALDGRANAGYGG